MGRARLSSDCLARDFAEVNLATEDEDAGGNRFTKN
jgi:hypothetical protein